jgi:acyl carrier protein
MEEALSISNVPSIQPRMNDQTADIRFDELEIDSLAVAEISMMIEDECGYVCDLGDFLAYPSVQSLADHISAQGARRSK